MPAMGILGGEDVVEWAETMGFPGADSPEFKANAGRLVTPRLTAMWRHLIEHVRPANEVALIRKQLLEYKLSVENNPSVDSLEKFESVADYEAFLKKRALEAKMAHCNMQVKKKQEDIKKLSTKLENKAEQHRLQKLEEKEKIEKLRLLRAKREELEEQVVLFKQLGPVVESVMQPYASPHCNRRALDSWELEVREYCASLERGQEISLMCEHLRETLKTEQPKVKETSSGNEELMFHQVIEEYHCRLGFKMLELKERYNTKLEELEAKKQSMISTMTSSRDVSLVARAGMLKKVIESGHLEAIRKAAERAFLVQWIHNNRTSFDNSLNTSYVEEREKVAGLDHLISQVQDEITFFSSFPATKLSRSLAAIVSKMEAEAKEACFKEKTPATVVNKILSDLPQLIELFRKTPMTMKKVDPGTQSMQAYTKYETMLSKMMTAKAVTSLDVSVKEKITDPSSMIEQVQGKVAREKSKMGLMLNDLAGTLHEIDQNLLHINGHQACWENCSPAEVICNNQDFKDLLMRLKNTLQECS